MSSVGWSGQTTGSPVPGSGFRVPGSVFRVPGSRFRVPPATVLVLVIGRFPFRSSSSSSSSSSSVVSSPPHAPPAPLVPAAPHFPAPAHGRRAPERRTGRRTWRGTPKSSEGHFCPVSRAPAPGRRPPRRGGGAAAPPRRSPSQITQSAQLTHLSRNAFRCRAGRETGQECPSAGSDVPGYAQGPVRRSVARFAPASASKPTLECPSTSPAGRPGEVAWRSWRLMPPPPIG